jgi:hypothetical protein
VGILANFSPKGWIGLLVNCHTVCLGFCLFFLWSQKDRLDFGRSNTYRVIDSTHLSIDGGATFEISDYVPAEEYEAASRAVLNSHMKRNGASRTAIIMAAKEIVRNGYGRKNAAYLTNEEAKARENKYGIWGGGSIATDKVEFDRLKEKLRRIESQNE